MRQNKRGRLLRLLMLLICLVPMTSLLAQESTGEPPTEPPVIITTEAPTDIATDAPTEAPVVPSEAPTDVPTAAATVELPTEAPIMETPVETAEAPVATAEAPVVTAAPSEAVTDAPIVIPEILAPEPPLTLLLRDLFEEGSIPAHWVAPVGWMFAPTADGHAIQISASSRATLSDPYADVAVMGYFTFVDQAGAAQLVVREGAGGAYVATLNASGFVTLEKRDSAGVSVVLKTADAPAVTNAARGLRLSVMGSVLRVSVDNVEVIALQDAAPLPAGQVSVQTVFAADAPGTILFDNFFLWIPDNAVSAPIPATQDVVTVESQTQETPAEAVIVASDPAPAAALPMAVLNPPVLKTPVVNTHQTTLRPVFSWNAVTGANRYHLQVATNFSCSTLVSPDFDVVVATLTHTFATPLPQGEYWFCVEALNINDGSASGFGEKRRFVVNLSLLPTDKKLIVPLNGGTSAPVTFTWTKVVGATYHLEVATDSSFTAFAVDTPVTGETSTHTLPFGEYYWRVHINGAGMPASLSHRVTVTPPLPAGPLIQTPAPIPHLGFTYDTTPMLGWKIPANWVPTPQFQSLTYELDLATSSAFGAASLVAPTVTGVAATQYEWTNTTLANTAGTVYYWRVRARTNLGLYGAYSPTYSFTLDTEAPNPPTTLTAPLNNAVSTSARPAFSWGVAPTAKGYILELSDAADFNELANNLSYNAPLPTLALPAFALPVSHPQGVNPLYWRVRARDAAGNVSTPSLVSRALRIDYALAPVEGYAKVVVNPATTSPIVFSWTPVIGLTGAVYNVSIYTNSTLTTLLHESGPIATAAWASPALNVGEYWWVLSVSDTAGTTNGAMGTSLPRRFVVSAPLPSVPVAPFAPAVAPTNDTTPSFNWGTPLLNAGNIFDYQLQISTDKTFANPAVTTSYIVGARPFILPTPLPDTAAQTYYWRVRPHTALDLYGPFTLATSFTLDTTDPTAPQTLTAPLDNAISVTARPAFSWVAGAGANRYRIEIATDNGFGNIIHQGTPTLPSYVSGLSLAQGTYYWQVWSLDAAGNESPTPSVTRTFTVDYRTAPLANATSFTATTSKVIFSWGLVTAAPVGTTYAIEIDADFDGTSDPALNLPPVTIASTSALAVAQGDYQYRLVVSNGFGTSGWRTFIVSPLLPGAPAAPFAPVHASATNDPTPTLQWGAPTVNPGNVIGYRVDVSTAANFSAPIAGSPFDIGNTTSLTLPVLPDTPGQIYYWRVRARAPFNQFGPYNLPPAPPSVLPRSFTLDTSRPSDVTTLTAPLDTAVVSAARPAFSWAAAPGANRYKIQIDTSSGFASPDLIEATPTLPSYTIPVATRYLQQGTHYWRVWGMDAAGNVSDAPSPVRALVINYPLTPADNAVFTSVAPAHVAFTWAAIPGTASNTIRIQIDNDSNFSSPERTSPLLAVTKVAYTTSLAGTLPNANPLPHGKYYWRLLVTGHANPSLTRSFTIRATPGATVLSATVPALNTSDTTPGFSWNAVPSAAGATITGYEFQLSTVANFASLVGGASVPVAGGGTTSLTWSPALPDTAGQIYYARIRSLTSLGAVGAWSLTRSFTLDTQAPISGPTLSSPADNGSVTTQRPTFQWTALGGATHYDIRYGTQVDLSAITPTRVTTLTHVPAGNLLFTTYYWQVRAIDAAGNIGPYTTPRAVSISSAPGAAPTLWNYTSSTPTLTWTPLAWAVSYDIQVSTNNTFTAIVWQTTGIAATNAPSVTVGTPLANGTYYWRVKGKLPVVVSGPHNEPFSAIYVVTVEAP